MSLAVRPATAADVPFLWHMLTYAASMDGTEADIMTAPTDPNLVHYVDGFPRDGDVGVIAESDGTRIGATWVRLAPRGVAPSLMKVWTDTVPELAIATVPSARGAGIGTKLLEALYAAARTRHRSIALSVREESPAVRLYERHGFVVVTRVVNRVGSVSVTMHRML
jgi:GNAT superfamily N-acetyltransferase